MARATESHPDDVIPNITRRLIVRLEAILLPQDGKQLNDLQMLSLVRSYLPGIAKVAAEYGELSRAVYLIKYIFAGRVFSLYAQRVASGINARRIEEAQKLFDILREDLATHFLQLIYWDNIPADRTAYTERIEEWINGRLLPLYRYSRDIYNSNLLRHEAKIKPFLLSVTQKMAYRIKADCTYLYCINAENELIIFNRPLTYEELITGVRQDSILVKHPMLVQDYDLTVRCAGDIWIAKDRYDHIAGILASRASGQFRPGAEAIDAIYEMVRERLGLPNETVAVIGKAEAT